MHKCILPWISIEATPMGTTRPCCLYTDEIPNINLKNSTLDDAFNSKTMRDLRRSFRRDEKPEGCRNCWREEDAGKKSKRQYMLEKFKHLNVEYKSNNGEQLVFLDLKLGNICNLKCRICGSWSSSKWAQEELNYVKDPTDHIAKKWIKDGQWVRKSPKFWDNLDELLPQIKYFEFTGGEPWMIKQHFELLQRAVKKGFAKDIDIHYNTNTTQYPKDPTIWKHFKHVQIAFSVDNTGERFEYERYGAKWKTSNSNIKKVHKLREQGYPITTQLCCTWNIQNIFYIDEILTWAYTMDFDSIHFNVMHDPWEFSISRTPKIARATIMLYLQKQQIKHSKYANDIHALKQMIVNANMNENPEEPQTGEALHKKLRKTDLYRNQNFAISHSKIAKAIKYEL
jgi:MoaA/NifB/PqqE/SkfB family radical SAM enzyme